MYTGRTIIPAQMAGKTEIPANLEKFGEPRECTTRVSLRGPFLPESHAVLTLPGWGKAMRVILCSMFLMGSASLALAGLNGPAVALLLFWGCLEFYSEDKASRLSSGKGVKSGVETERSSMPVMAGPNGVASEGCHMPGVAGPNGQGPGVCPWKGQGVTSGPETAGCQGQDAEDMRRAEQAILSRWGLEDTSGPEQAGKSYEQQVVSNVRATAGFFREEAAEPNGRGVAGKHNAGSGV